jgi:glutathione-regulated potassium-efflux system ancillary protein KefF
LPSIVVIAAHPHVEHSRVNRALMRAATGDALKGRAELRDLYALYPDYLIDVAAEQRALAETRLVVWLHPWHWYGATPLLKLWMDEVLAFGWAYGPGGHALAGKDLWLVTSTGGRAEAYRPEGHNRHFIDAFLLPYEQTAALCGMSFLPPLVLHGAHHLDDAQVDAHAHGFAQRLARYPDWPEIAELGVAAVPELGRGERPMADE